MHSILVTGVGGGVGQSIIKSLQGTDYRVVGADGEALAAGLYAVDRAYKIPYANDAGFIERLLEIADHERCRLLFPGLDAELLPLAKAADRFAAIGTRVVVSQPDVVAICDDKLLTSEFLASHGFPFPKTCVLDDHVISQVPLPAILKPRKGGARSRGVFVVSTVAQIERHRDELDVSNYVLQERIEGDEYTCGTVTLGGECEGVIVMRRILRDGDTYKAFVIKDPKLTEFVKSVADRLGPFGACNFQLRIRDDTPYIFEFNARCSGTTFARTAAGFNEPLMIADYLIKGNKPIFDIKEITVLRYWNELVVDNRRITEFGVAGAIDGEGGKL